MNHWACQETQTASFGDQRLNKRFTSLLQQLGDHPEESIPTACGDWAATQAAYRFFGNEKVTFDSVLESHKQASLDRISEQPVVLLLQDTTTLKYTHTPVPKGLGTLSDQDHEKIFLHLSVAVTPQRVCLGVLGGEVWQRTTPSPRLERRQKTIAEKESHRWVTGYQLACEVRRAAEQTLIVNVADAAGDLYEWFAEALKEPVATRAEWLIRAGQDRRLAPTETERKLRQKLLKQPSLGEVGVRLPAKPGQQARDAILTVKATRARLRAPARTVGQKLKNLDVYAVLAVEENPPPSHEPIVWCLLTSLPVTQFESAVQVLEWYSCRWEIEVFFKVLKTGCRTETVTTRDS